jgi:exonuclease III
MSSTPKSLLVASLNVEGIRRNDAFVKLLMREVKLDFFCLQETWLCEQDSLSLETLCNEFSYRFFAKAGVDCNENVVAGRVPGGVAILYRHSLDHAVKIVNVQNRRICAMTILVNNYILLLINVYLPWTHSVMYRERSTRVH